MNRSTRRRRRRRNANLSFLVLLPLAAVGGPILAAFAFLFAGATFF
ncbi:TPA: hypothetical protein UMB92_003147 [Stenotrophomonas maltophilia]|nr:hypothetical protein [Stenotrophomonas maltophilia]